MYILGQSCPLGAAMFNKLVAAVTLLILLTVSGSVVLAFPTSPFDSSAAAKGVQVGLNLPVAQLDVLVGNQEANLLDDSVQPLSTDGTGEGVNVTLLAGTLLDAEVDIVNIASAKTMDGDSTPVTDSAFLLSLDSLLVDTGVFSRTTTSQITATAGQTTGEGSVSGLTIYGDALGATDLVTAGTVSESVSTSNDIGTTYGNAQSVLTTVSVDVVDGVTPVNILTASVITATTTTASDGTLPGADATADVAFVGLTINATDYSLAPPNTVITVTQGATDIARVTIRPTTSTSTSATSSSAGATALQIDVLVSTALGTSISLADATSTSATSPTSPSAISLNRVSVHKSNILRWPLLLMGLLSLMTLAQVRKSTSLC